MVAFLPKYRLQAHIQIGSTLTKINCLSPAITSIEIKIHQRFNIIRKKQKGATYQMERIFYWLRKTVKRNKQCKCLCMTCEYYDLCRMDN